MNVATDLYRHSLTLLTDLYQLTMAYAYWKNGLAERDSVFQLTFRRPPFRGQYAIACGLGYVIDLLRAWRFTDDDLAYLATLLGRDQRPLFDRLFLDYLRGVRFTCDVDAIAEGTAVFAHEPLVRIRGPLLQAQILETALLNIVNFQTLIATKASRVCAAARGEPVMEFGLRRSQGMDGGLAASRAAFIGGCESTSNVLAGKLFDIPVRGTHAHSWVMTFDSELAAFQAYADALPNNCVFLVDTYDTLTGVRHAAEVGQRLRAAGHEMIGIRLDSGDLGKLSIETRRILDDAGFPDASIVASNDLDEWAIVELKDAGAKINVWGVGTKLVTAHDQPALGGVYKLAALRDERGEWQPRIKLSEEPIKISNPGLLQVRRFSANDDSQPQFVGDVLWDERFTTSPPVMAVHLSGEGTREFSESLTAQELLRPIFRQGELVYESPSLSGMRQHTQRQLASLAASVTRWESPTPYWVGLETRVHALKQQLIAEHRRPDRNRSD